VADAVIEADFRVSPKKDLRKKRWRQNERL